MESTLAPVAGAVVEVASLVVQLVRSEVRQHQTTGLAYSQVRALRYLRDNPGASLSEVAEGLGLGAPTVSKAVNGLVEGGMVRRKGDRQDRRRVVLRLTPSGEAALRQASEVAHAEVARLLSPLSDEEVETVARAMSLLRPLFTPPARPDVEEG